eukprot:12909376-Alexandrium_andersonii.AAC.1
MVHHASGMCVSRRCPFLKCPIVSGASRAAVVRDGCRGGEAREPRQNRMPNTRVQTHEAITGACRATRFGGVLCCVCAAMLPRNTAQDNGWQPYMRLVGPSTRP